MILLAQSCECSKIRGAAGKPRYGIMHGSNQQHNGLA